MEIVSIIFDVILIACMGRLIFECGVWYEKTKQIEALYASVADCRILSENGENCRKKTLDTPEAKSTEADGECACVGDTNAMPPLVKPPEATETDFEGVKIWKPYKKKKADRKPPEA